MVFCEDKTDISKELATKNSTATIELFEVEKTFNSGKANHFTALKGISLSIPLNRITVFKGPSGSGKTTLVNIIGCMSSPTSGRARSFSGLATHHFLRSYTIQEIGSAGAAAMADDVALLAEAEGLPAHAAAARARA